MRKKIMFLGAGVFQIPPIRYAKEQGHYVITCDYLPDNPGHEFANEYINISTIDKAAVLHEAERLKIDAIVAYASDVSAPTAAFVGNRLGLPSNPYDSVVTMTRKDLFKAHLKDHNFNIPLSYGCDSYSELLDAFDDIRKPVMIKPADASGSKGVSKVYEKNDLQEAFDQAMSFSICKKIIAEEFLVRKDYQIAGDGFLVDGQLVFRCFANEHFDKLGHPMVPIGESFPATLSQTLQEKSHAIIQRLLSGLNMQMGALNFDFLIDRMDNVYILEIGPRNGGNLIPEVTRYLTGVDMIKHTVDIALGYDCSSIKMDPPSGFYASYIVHSLRDGVFQGVAFEESFRSNIVEENLFMKPGDQVRAFNNATLGVGSLILKFDSQEEMLEKMENSEKYVQVQLRD